MLLRMTAGVDGDISMEYRLYDATGSLVSEAQKPRKVAKGITVTCPGGEILLDVPADCDKPLSYRLYNKDGHLLTFSNGARTVIYGELRMENARL